MKFKTILLILIFFSNFLFAQESFSGYYQQLSSIAYKSYADSLEKNWNCPVVYNRKETQKKYAEIWNSRKTSLLESIRNDEFVKIDKINTYLNELVKKITQGSPKDFPSPIKVFFNRTSDINAYSIGSNIIVVNAGMLSYVRSEEELLLI